MIIVRSIIFCSLLAMIATEPVYAEPLPGSMPVNLQGMPPAVKAAAQNIQETLINQNELIKKASQAKTPAEREEVFQAVTRNVQVIAQKRVVLLEHYTDRAKARVDWARKHAEEVSASDLTKAMKEITSQGPRPPFPVESNSPETADKSIRAKLPEQVRDAQVKLQQTLIRLKSLVQQCKLAQTDEQRKEIKEEIDDLLQVIQEQRIVILETVFEVSEKRLKHAKTRAKEAGTPSAINK